MNMIGNLMHPAIKEPEVSIDPSYFRRVMRRLATGVTVITVRDGNTFHGMTANTFTSVSLTPTLVLVSVMNESMTHRLLERSGSFAVNILSAAQRRLAERFAHQAPMPPDPFADIPFHTGKTGAAIFDDCIAYVDCRVVAAHEAGDHTLFIGEVLDLGFGNAKDAQPLLWLDGKYTTIDDK
jgi:flavin reductase (DIM6/NTAB) family NADH-FMN oxidoreductase RutF